MSENKTGKYLKYAIGEIILVVIGILIALGINNWNENRKNRVLEQNYVEELIIDLQKDSTAIKGLLTQSNNQLEAKYLLYKYLSEQIDFSDYTLNFSHYPESLKTRLYDKDSLVYYYRMQYRPSYNFIPIKTTIDEMKSTGKIGIIADQKLRRSIIETYNNYESFLTSYQAGYNNNQNETMNIILDEIPELYRLSNSNLQEVFQSTRVINRFVANHVVTLNFWLKRLEQVNQKLLNELNEYAKRN